MRSACRSLAGIGALLVAACLAVATANAGTVNGSWTSPTTNADGTNLTDLAFFRLYFSSATSTPCPGSPFIVVPAPSASPAPSTTVNATITGLTTGTSYNAAVSAVDTSGNESACSNVASAFASIDFDVAPTGTTDFGTVGIGSTADQMFTVSNTGGGTVSGTATIGPPFSIVSGSPFNLVGVGATASVKVRFTPTTAAGVSSAVSFKALGGTISRGVTGTGVDVPGSVQFASATASVNENVAGGTTNLTVNRTGGGLGGVTVDYSVTGGTAPNDNSRFILANGTLTFGTGDTSKPIPVTIVNNSVIDGNQTVIVTLSNPQGGLALGARTSTTLTIVDDDTSLQFSAATYSVAENAGTATITVTRSGSTANQVTVRFATSDGTAHAGTDYTASSGPLTFGAGVTSKTFTVPVIDNTIVDGSRTVNLQLSSPGGTSAILGTPASAVLTITDNDVAGTVQFASATASVAENVAGGTTNLTVTRSGGVASGVTVNYAVSGGTAPNDGSRYVLNAGALTFNAGETSKAIAVTIVNNNVLDGNQTVVVTLSSPGGGATLGSPTSTTLTIIDDDQPGSVQFASATASVNENVAGGTTTLTVNRTGGAAGGVTVDYAVTGGSAPNDGSRYVLASGTLTFGGGDTSKTIPVTIVNNSVVDGDKTVVVTLRNPQGGLTLGAPVSTTLTIVDDDTSLQFSAATYSVAENGGTATITVTRAGSTANQVTVRFATSDGTGHAGADYTASSGTLTFGAGVTSKTFTVPVIDNTIVDGNRTVNLQLSSPGGTSAILGTPNSAVLTITETDVAGTVQFASASASVAENVVGGTTALTVTRTGGAASGVTVNYAVTGGTAPNDGSRYVLSAGTLTFNAGDTSKTIPVTIVNNSVVDGNQTVVVTLSNPGGGATLGSPGSTTLTIIDDDKAGTVQFATAAVSVSEASGVANLTVTRTGGLASGVTVAYAVNGGTAVSGRDYSLTPGTVTFNAGEISKTIPLTIISNGIVTGNLTVIVSLSNPQGGATLGAPASETITILDVEVGLQFSAPTYNVVENGGLATITVVRSGSSTTPVTVDYTDAVGGSAVNGTDYTLVPGTLTFAAGVTSRTFTVRVIDNTIVDGDRTVNLVLQNPTGGAGVAGQGTATLTIHDNDVAGTFAFGAPTFSVGVAAATSAAAATSVGASVMVARSGGAASGVTVDYDTVGITAVDGTDFIRATGTLTFGAGEMSKPIMLQIPRNTLARGSRTVQLTLSNPGSGGRLGAPNPAVLTIANSNVGGSLAFSAAAYGVVENAGLATITVTRTGGAASGVSVQYATTDGSARAGTDYTATNGTLTFGAGVMSQTFTVPITDDNIVDGNRTILLALSTPTDGGTLGGQRTATLTILDDETGLQFSAPNYNVAENAGLATITVTRLGSTTSTVMVSYATVPGGTAVSGTDYTAVNGTLTFGPGVTTRTFTVPIKNNTVVNANRTVALQLSNPSGALLGPPSSTQLTIVNTNLGGTVKFSAATYAVSEATPTAMLTVVRTGGAASGVTVDYAVTGGTAVNGADYTLANGTLTFNAGEMSKAIAVAIINNTIVDGARTVVVTLSNVQSGGSNVPGAATLGSPSSATLRINDDDVGGRLQFNAAAYTVNENAGTATITVTRTSGAARNVTVQYATSDGTALAGTDYTAASGTLTFGAGTPSLTFQVPIPASARVGNRTVQLTLSSPGGGGVLGTPATALLTIVDNMQAGVEFSAPTYRVAENAGMATITVVRFGPTPMLGTMTVQYATSDGTAVSGTDYTAVNGTLTFGPGVTTRTFTVPIKDNTVVNPNKTVNLALTIPTGGGLGVVNTAQLTIVDNDLGGTVKFGTATYAVSEATPTALLTVVRTGGAASGVTVDYAITGGTAVNGADYTLANGTLTFNAGEMSKAIAVAIINNTIVDGARTVVVTLSNVQSGASNVPAAATLGSPSSATLTINDNDVGGRLQFSAAAYTVNENLTSATITVTRAGGAASNVTVQYATSDGTALAGTDYTALSNTSNTLTFNAGDTSKSFSVAILPSLRKGNRTVGLTLSNPGGGGVLGMPATATLTIVDNLQDGMQFSAPTYSVAENAGMATITVTRFGPTPAMGTLTVQYVTSDGTAVNGADYTAVNGTLTFGPGVMTRTFTVPVKDNTIVDGNKTVNLTLTMPSGGSLGVVSTAVLTIVNNDLGGTVRFSAATYAVSEATPTALLTVVRSGGAASGVTVDYAVTGGTAVNGTDYTLANGTLTFNAGEMSKAITVVVNNDTVVDGPQTVVVALSNMQGRATLGSPSTATLTIKENDVGGRLQFSAATYTVNENVASGLFTATVTRTGGLASNVTVNYAATGGTAVNGTDYTLASGTLTFNAGDLTKTFTIAITNDTLAKGNRTVVLTLSGPAGGGLLGAPASATLTIVDNDVAGSVGFASPMYSIPQTAGTASIAVMRLGGAASGVSVDYSVIGGTAQAGVDYTLTPATLTFGAGEMVKIITVTVVNTGTPGPKTVQLHLTNPVGGALLGAPSAATLTIN